MDGAIERSENEGDITISLWTLSNEWIKPAIDDFSKNLARKHWSFLTLTYTMMNRWMISTLRSREPVVL